MITTQWVITDIQYSPSGDVVILQLKSDELFSFIEGQFMMLQTLIDDKIVKRAYSIYSTNQQLQDSQTISFCIKRKEWGLFSTRATQGAKEGIKITMTWPVGKFIDNGVHKDYLFISVGSGLSPCFSIYTYLLQSWNYHKIANLFGERYLDHIPDQVLQHYSIQNEKVKNMIYLSREVESHKQKVDRSIMGDSSTSLSLRSEWRKSGYVQDWLDEALVFLHGEDYDTMTLWHSITIFICGLPAMCDDVAERLLEKWFEKSQLVIEKY